MNWKIKYSALGVALWFLLFLGWEWWRSYPKVRFFPITNPHSRDERIDSLLVQSLSQFLIPGIAVGLIEDEKVTYLRAAGYGNLESKDSLTLETTIPVASVSKLFTALTLANLALERGISIDTTFNSLLPRGKKLPAEFDAITLRELLEHTSGLSDNSGIQNMLLGEEKRKLSNISKNLNSPDLENKAYAYADANFDLIGYVLQNCTKIPFDTLLKEGTLSAAGMEQSYFLGNNPSNPFPTLGYKQTFLWKRMQSISLKIERLPSPSSGLIVTPRDLSKALLHICRGNMGIFAEELEWLKSGSSIPAGFQKITLNNTEFIGHFGGSGGYSSLVLYSPALETGFFLLSNSQDNSDFRRHIAARILHLTIP